MATGTLLVLLFLAFLGDIVKIFFKRSGNMFLKCFIQNVIKTFYQNVFLTGIQFNNGLKCDGNVQSYHYKYNEKFLL